MSHECPIEKSQCQVTELQESRFFGAWCCLIGAGWIWRFRLRRRKSWRFRLEARKKLGGFAFGEEIFGGLVPPSYQARQGCCLIPRQLLQLGPRGHEASRPRSFVLRYGRMVIELYYTLVEYSTTRTSSSWHLAGGQCLQICRWCTGVVSYVLVLVCL